MDMRMKFEFLIPGVQHAEETNLCTEMFGIASDFEKSFRTGTKQEIVDDLLVLQNQWGQLAGKCEDHMHVARRKKFSATLLRSNVREHRSDTSGNADFGRSCRRWRDVRSECTHRDARRARRCDTAQWPAAL